ncbi:MAG TPA: ethanolamine ammonia-lyase subunit EutC [Candidatus Angelobacter sp.]|jgi:ethanolamine ammonia-lyase small subunit|nr:ethanolamine ammonia-lyase subunit EutC [Candidatus Angelobacter sp.]
MSGSDNNVTRAQADVIQRIRSRTPARVLVNRAGSGYLTSTQMDLREAHAAAQDAVRTEFAMETDLGADFCREWKLFEARTRARSKDEYLLRPDMGRTFDPESVRLIQQECQPGADLQIIIGDGLSVTAVATQVPQLLPALVAQATAKGWSTGRLFAIRHCRVGILNEIGELLRPKVVVLLIGERPGLATAESLSAYMAFRPKKGDNDARRNLISNIHERGVKTREAAARIIALAEQMMRTEASGVQVKEELKLPGWIQERLP